MVTPALVAASTKPLILALLARTEKSYGYEIMQLVRELSGGSLDWSDGMLYPVLHRLERDGLIESWWGRAESGRRRKYYRLRREGALALAEEKVQWMQVHETLAKVWNAETPPV